MRFSNHSKVYLETALLKMSQVSEGVVSTQSIDLSSFEMKIEQLERTVTALEQQVRQGITGNGSANTQVNEPKKRQRPKSQSGFKVPSGRISEVLKTATKQDIQLIKSHWATIMNQLQKSHAALLNEAEPVAASSSTFVLKFKYDIHSKN